MITPRSEWLVKSEPVEHLQPPIKQPQRASFNPIADYSQFVVDGKVLEYEANYVVMEGQDDPSVGGVPGFSYGSDRIGV